MALIVLSETIENQHWFDANPVMINFLEIKNEINAELDEANISASSDISINSLQVSSYISGELFNCGDSLNIDIVEGTSFNIIESNNTYFSVNEDGVTI